MSTTKHPTSPIDELLSNLSTLSTDDLSRIAATCTGLARTRPESKLVLALAPLASWLLKREPRGPLGAPAGLTARELRSAACVVAGCADDLVEALPHTANAAAAFRSYALVLVMWAIQRDVLN